jgi:L-rhamnose mutarotase
MKRFALALDLKNDEKMIAEYEAYHKKLRPEIEASIRESGIIGMEIYRFTNRLFMIMETVDDFSFERKAAMDEGNEKVAEWEALMWTYQQPVPGALPGQKWILMDKIFEL